MNECREGENTAEDAIEVLPRWDGVSWTALPCRLPRTDVSCTSLQAPDGDATPQAAVRTPRSTPPRLPGVHGVLAPALEPAWCRRFLSLDADDGRPGVLAAIGVLPCRNRCSTSLSLLNGTPGTGTQDTQRWVGGRELPVALRTTIVPR